MAFTLSPWVRQQFFDDDGVPLALGKVYTYISGTSTPLDTYDAADGSANTNPIILDSAGMCDMWLGPYSYKFEITDADDVPVQTIDGVSAIPLTNVDLLITGTAGENLTAGNALYLSDGTVGTAGRWYKTDSDVAASSTLAKYVGFAPADIASGEVGSIQIQGKVTGLSALSPGSVYYCAATAGAITSTPPANARPMGVADSTTTLIIPAGTPEATATVPGIVSTGTQTFGGVKTLVSPTFTTGGSWTGSPSLTSPVFAAMPTGIGAFVFGRATADLTKNNNDTFADVTGLAFTAEANASYIFLWIIHYITPAGANIKFQLTGPAAPTAVRYGLDGVNLVGTGDTAEATAFSTSMGVTSTSAIDRLALIVGNLRNGANVGAVQLQAAQSTLVVGDTKVYAESSVIAWRIS